MSRFLEVVHFLEWGGAARIKRSGSCSSPRPASSPTITLGLTHVPGAYEDRDHVWLILLGMLVLHELQKLAEGFSLLGTGEEGNTAASQGPYALTNPTLPQGHPDLWQVS